MSKKHIYLIWLGIAVSMTVRVHDSVAQHGHPPQPALEVHFPTGTSVVEVPFRDVNGMIVVDVRVNGSEPIGFVIETGWAGTNLLMTDDMEDIELDFSSKGVGADRHSFGRPAKDVRLDIGGLQVEKANLEVASKNDNNILAMLPEDGILGVQFLKSVVVEIDWEHGRVRFHDPSTFERPESATLVPLEKRSGVIFASGDVTIDGTTKPIKFVVDTGSAGTLLLRSDRVGSPKKGIRDVTFGQSLYGPVKGDVARIDGLTFGGATLTGMVVRFLDGASNMVAVGADGNLGTGVLRRYVVTLDYANSRMFMRPTDSITDPFPFTRSGVGVDGKIADDGSIGIALVYKNSPADRAGLRAGDRIISLDATPVSQLGVDGVLERMRRPEGTKVMLKVRQNDATRVVKLRLATLL